MESTRPTQVVLREDHSQYKVTVKDGAQTDPILLSEEAGADQDENLPQRNRAKESGVLVFAYYLFYREPLESHMPRLALSATQSLPPPTLAGCHVLSSSLHKLNGETENPVQPMLNIWRLGRGAGLKLGKLL